MYLIPVILVMALVIAFILFRPIGLALYGTWRYIQQKRKQNQREVRCGCNPPEEWCPLHITFPPHSNYPCITHKDERGKDVNQD